MYFVVPLISAKEYIMVPSCHSGIESQKILQIYQITKEVSFYLSSNGDRHGLAGASLVVESHQLQGVPAQPEQTPPSVGSDNSNCKDLAR